jgi:hypothetical protein
MKICVYCASSHDVDHLYFKETEVLARGFVQHDIEVVYGGGAIGLMGRLADTMLENGGKIKGVIPRFMHDLNWSHQEVADMVITETMHERKALYLEGVDGIVALPGGSGTLEELLEVMTLKRLGQFSKPIMILNINGFYNGLRDLLEKCVDQNFMEKGDLHMWRYFDSPAGVLDYIISRKDPSTRNVNLPLGNYQK